MAKQTTYEVADSPATLGGLGDLLFERYLIPP